MHTPLVRVPPLAHTHAVLPLFGVKPASQLDTVHSEEYVAAFATVHCSHAVLPLFGVQPASQVDTVHSHATEYVAAFGTVHCWHAVLPLFIVKPAGQGGGRSNCIPYAE